MNKELLVISDHNHDHFLFRLPIYRPIFLRWMTSIGRSIIATGLLSGQPTGRLKPVSAAYIGS